MISLIKPLITNLLLWIWVAAFLFLWWIIEDRDLMSDVGDRSSETKDGQMLTIIKHLICNLLLWIWIAAALFLWWITRENRQFRRYGFCFLALFWVLSTRPVTDAILLPLESAYNPPTISSLKAQGIDQIVVLSGGGGLRTGKDRSQTSDIRDPQITQITQKEKEHVSRKGAKALRGKEDERTEDRDRKTPLLNRKDKGIQRGKELGSSISVLPHATAYRLWGALELASRLGPDCELIVIGSPNGDTRIMEGLAHVLMPGRKVVSKTHLGGTSEHPKNVESFVGEKEFILVTSAMHMKRAVWCFEQQGLKPVAYPVDFLCGGKYRWTDFLPSVDNLWKLNIVFREYLALGWYAVKGYF